MHKSDEEGLGLFKHFLHAKLEPESEALVHTDLCSEEIQTMEFRIKPRSPLQEAVPLVLDVHGSGPCSKKHPFLFVKCFLSREMSPLLQEAK